MEEEEEKKRSSSGIWVTEVLTLLTTYYMLRVKEGIFLFTSIIPLCFPRFTVVKVLRSSCQLLTRNRG